MEFRSKYATGWSSGRTDHPGPLVDDGLSSPIIQWTGCPMSVNGLHHSSISCLSVRGAWVSAQLYLISGPSGTKAILGRRHAYVRTKPSVMTRKGAICGAKSYGDAS